MSVVCSLLSSGVSRNCFHVFGLRELMGSEGREVGLRGTGEFRLLTTFCLENQLFPEVTTKCQDNAFQARHTNFQWLAHFWQSEGGWICRLYATSPVVPFAKCRIEGEMEEERGRKKSLFLMDFALGMGDHNHLHSHGYQRWYNVEGISNKNVMSSRYLRQV